MNILLTWLVLLVGFVLQVSIVFGSALLGFHVGRMMHMTQSSAGLIGLMGGVTGFALMSALIALLGHYLNKEENEKSPPRTSDQEGEGKR